MSEQSQLNIIATIQEELDRLTTSLASLNYQLAALDEIIKAKTERAMMPIKFELKESSDENP